MESRNIPKSADKRKAWSQIAQKIHYGHEVKLINALWDALIENREYSKLSPNGSYFYYELNAAGKRKSEKERGTTGLIPDVSNSVAEAVKQLDDHGFREFTLDVSYNGIEGKWTASCRIRNLLATEKRGNRDITIASAIAKAMAVNMAGDEAPNLKWGGDHA